MRRAHGASAWPLRLVAAVVIALSSVSPVNAAGDERGREIHGASDVFATEGVAIAWAILRAANPDDATVVMRIALDDKRHRALGVVAVDPFGGQSQSVRSPAPVAGTVDVPSRRGRFGDFARTEVRLYASASPGTSDAPAITIYYQGVPDTAPEFDSEAKLRAWLGEQIVRLRERMKGGKP